MHTHLISCDRDVLQDVDTESNTRENFSTDVTIPIPIPTSKRNRNPLKLKKKKPTWGDLRRQVRNVFCSLFIVFIFKAVTVGRTKP